MDPQAIPYVLSLIAAGLVSLVVGHHVWRRHPAPGARPLSVLMAGAGTFALPYALQIACTRLRPAMLWYGISFPGAVLLAPAWLVFALQYTGREHWLTRRNLILLGIVPMLTILLAWSNDLHGLYASDFRLKSGGPFPILSWSRGPGFWLHAAYAYVASALGMFVLAEYALRTPSLYRRQIILLLCGTFAPVAGNVIFLLGLSPVPELDLSPFAFALTGLIWELGLYRYKLFDVIPIARDAIVEQMDNGMIVLDAQHRIVDVNAAAADILDQPVSEIIGQSTAQLGAVWSDVFRPYRGPSEIHQEIHVGDGIQQRHFDLRISPLHNRRGHFGGQLVMLRDITPHKRAQEKLERYAAELEDTNRQLARSNAELERFAFVASHHLQEPLRTVVNHLQMLERRYADQLDVSAQEFIAYAVGDAIWMGTMIKDLLSLSQIEKRGVTFKPTDCNTVLDQALAVLQEKVQESDAAITRTPLPTVVADEMQLGQVFQHLIDNALKFRASDRPPRIHVMARRSRDLWHFSVCDNGIGIEPPYHTRIFELFQRLHTRETYPGTGIGLTLCQKIIERHGGRIWVNSCPGAGSTFTFTLPACETQVPA